jgi:amino acid adenylation domain-containing protein
MSLVPNQTHDALGKSESPSLGTTEVAPAIAATVQPSLRDGDFRQFRAVLDGTFDLPWLAEAFARVARRLFATEAAFELHDWRRLGEAAREQRRSQLLVRDHAALPRERVALCRIDADTNEIVWSFRESSTCARSMADVLSEVFATYRVLTGGNAAAPPMQAAAPEPDAPASVEPAEARAYFRQLLDGIDAPTAAPGAEPNGRRSSASGFGHLEQSLPLELCRALTALAERSELRLDGLARAAWGLLLSRFSGDDDVVFAVASHTARGAGRTGAFVRNRVPFRVRVTGELRIRDYLATVHALELAARPFAELAPEAFASSLAAAGSLAQESVLVLEPHPFSALLSSTLGPRIRSGALHEEPSVPLVAHLWQHDDGSLALAFDFARERFRPGMVERVLDAYVLVLEELTSGDEQPLRELQALRPAERRKQLKTWNETARAFDETRLFHEHFEEAARARPRAIAVESQTSAVTYAELDAEANRLAHALRARGAGPGVRVGICLERGVPLVSALLGVAKSGAAYVPLDPAYPAERLQKIAEDCAPALVVTQAEYADRFKGELVLVGVTDLSAFPCTPLERISTPTDDCYVIYTSGSTGNPKGVVLQHRAVVNTCEWVTRELGIGPGDRLLFVTSPCFDLSVYDVFGALGAGATVIVAEQSLLLDPQALAATLLERGVTVWNSAPAMLELVMPFLTRETADPRLRLVMLSGDFIPLALVAKLRAAFPNATLLSLGGATEAAIWSNFHEIGRIEPDWVSVPYGRPLQNCRYYALDARLEPVPIGAVGELYIGGACLARGYLNQPELTTAKFVPDPFASDPGARLYRTGDLVRYFEDGEIEILGRADQQVKIRGYRIELWEIEAALADLPEVSQAVCAALKLDASGQRSLVAYVVLEEGRSTTESALKSALSQSLPDFMLPARIVFLPALPLSPNGKVERKALPAPGAHAEDRELVAPVTETERALSAIWQQILNRAAIGRDDDFFALGGHSLLAVALLERVKGALGADLPVTTILEHPTLAAFAARIDEASSARGHVEARAGVGAVVSFQRGGAAPELFCIGGLGGNPLGIRRLALELGAEQPVHGLYNPNFDARSVLSIEELARELFEEMRRVQPRGPYYLSGFSAGGVIAFEVARMLRAAGEEVPLLVMLDAYNPKLPRWSARERISLFLTMCDEAGVSYAWRRLRARLEFKLELAQLRLFGRRIGAPDDFFGMQAAFVLALARYVPRNYDGNVLLLRAAPGTASDVDYRTHESNGWRPLVRGELTVVNLGCRHEDVLRDHVAEVAHIMRRALRDVRARAARMTAPDA